ncbi:proton myo-inositol cotransporter isoform X3 [Parasteatoda tepidariorum]|uniref:proton myo-inositol cotransporter isoform X3 n=1 Tax=Parasteatoda tepidariorum TaxID=114398 RepID=UPI00077F8724|nr:proton myo-inositol cotransporter isoform X3 [Parasteatoda tepidariorum]
MMSDANEETLVLDKRQEKTPMFVYVVASLSAVGGLLFGYDTGVVSGAMILLRDYFNLDSTMQGVVVSVTIIAAWVTCLCAGHLSDRYGRKFVIISASIVFSIGSVLMGISANIGMLLAGRVIVGMGIGLASMCVPMYIAEISPQDIRGTLVTINNCAITLGQFIASLVDGAFSTDHVNGWRYMLGIAAVPAIIQLVGFIFMPESPRWLISKGRYDAALDVLRRTRGPNSNYEAEFETIKSNCLEVDREKENETASIIRQVLRNSSLRTALIVGCSLQAIQQLSGINTVMYYSATIIEMSGVKDKSKVIWLSAATSGMNCICSFIGLIFVERVGRRKLLLTSLVGVILSLTVLGISFQLADTYSPALTYQDTSTVGSVCHTFSSCAGCIDNSACGYCYTEYQNGTLDGTCLKRNATYQILSDGGLCDNGNLPPHVTWTYEWCPTKYSWITFLGLMLYLFFFAPGMGCMPWTINSEIYPLWARGTCYSIATSTNWLCNFVISLTFLDLMQAITKYGAFYFYDSLAVIGFVWLFLMLPETKGVSLEDVEGLFNHPWWKDATTSTEKKTVQD